MSSSTVADSTPLTNSDNHEVMKDRPDAMDSSPNHDLPARTNRDEQHEQHEQHEQTSLPKDDPATTAASEELKHTSISDKVACDPPTRSANTDVGSSGEDKIMIERTKAGTPEVGNVDAQDEEMRERLSSPRKKRGRDQEDTNDVNDESDDPTSSADGSVVNGSRTTRSEPEKKRRPRDTSEDLAKSAEKVGETKVDAANLVEKTSDASIEGKKSESEKSASPTMSTEKPRTSSAAFASSGFASLAAASTSPFGSLGASKPSIFGSGKTQTTTSGFGSLAANSSISTSISTTSGFSALGGKPTGGFSFGGGTSSGFGGLGSTSVFGSKLSNGFAGGSGPKLSSFAAPGKETVTVGAKPAKAFGAPESDEDGSSDDGGSDGGAATDDEESAPATEEKKKGKTTKFHIDDGEANETTLLQIRAKLFALESKEVGWKERGVGTLKINVPKSCASYDDSGLPIPGSFDASGLEDEDGEFEAPMVVRLVMRQENTHRVILNTIILAATVFQEKPAASTAQLLFTAFEGDKEPKPINMLLKMSEVNARLFRAEIDSIQRELSS